jgi:hypothetical protein
MIIFSLYDVYTIDKNEFKIILKKNIAKKNKIYKYENMINLKTKTICVELNN